MKPTEELMHEHKVVLHMLSGAERLAISILSNQSVDTAMVAKVIDFSRNFTDGCHHAKEEKHLFVKLVERGMPKEQGPVAVMLNEHQVGRDIIRSTEASLKEYESGRREAGDKIGQKLLQYVEFLRAHINKEDNVLFPMSDKVLTADDQITIEKAFKSVEKEETGAGVHEKYHRMAHEIAG